MCGLVGIAGKLIHKDEAVMKRLLVFDTLRGLDATGLAAVKSKKDEVSIAKAASNPFELFETKRFKAALSAWDSSVFIGHNRSATTGAKTSLNAHPFEFDHITGAHNGTLTTESWKELEKALGEEYDVDSQAFIAAIAKFGIKETIEMTQEGKTPQTGAWALTYYNSVDDSINFIRNDHRPLWVAYTKEFDKIFWASEWPMIHAALAMDNRLDELHRDENGACFFSLPSNTWFKAEIETLMSGGKECPLKPIAEVKGKEIVYSYTPPFSPAVGAVKTNTNKPGNRTSSVITHPSKRPMIFSFLAEKNEPFFDIIDPHQMAEVIHGGCLWCGDPITGSEPGSTFIEMVNGIVCPKCTGTDKVSRAVVGETSFETLYDFTQ